MVQEWERTEHDGEGTCLRGWRCDIELRCWVSLAVKFKVLSLSASRSVHCAVNHVEVFVRLRLHYIYLDSYIHGPLTVCAYIECTAFCIVFGTPLIALPKVLAVLRTKVGRRESLTAYTALQWLQLEVDYFISIRL